MMTDCMKERRKAFEARVCILNLWFGDGMYSFKNHCMERDRN